MGAPDVDADLLGLGRVCAVPVCGVRDFLPFTCAGCGAVTCADHRNSHACSAPAVKSQQVVVCPVCAKAVKLPPGADATDDNVVAVAMDAHARSQVSELAGALL